MTPTPPGARWPANLALAAAACALTLGAVELTLRATWTAERVTLVHDPLLGFRGRSHAQTVWTREMAGQPRTVRLNAGGFHDHERGAVPAPNTARLVFLGDSFAEAYQVEVDSSFSQRLARRLTDRAGAGRQLEAVNLGVHGYGLGVYALAVRQRLMAWHPDAVVLCLFLGNDLHDNFEPVASPAVPRYRVEREELVYLPAPAADLRTWVRDGVLARSVLVRWLWMRVIKTSGAAMGMARAAGMVSTPDLASDAAGRVDELLAVARRLLAQIASDLERSGVPLFVFAIPDPFHVHDLARRAPPSLERTAVEDGVLAILVDLGIPHLYPRDEFVRARQDGEGFYRGAFGHFADAAHPRVAALLEDGVWAMVAPLTGGAAAQIAP